MYRIECNGRRRVHVRTINDALTYLKELVVQEMENEHAQFCYSACNGNGLPSVSFHSGGGVKTWATVPIKDMAKEEESS